MIAKVSAAALRYWHPVLLSRQLKRTPVEVTLCGVEIVLYRTADQRVAALDNRCPHRKMRLALGKVEDDRIVCPYHGWSFQPDGKGTAPATPNMKVHTACYEVREEYGAIWLRASASSGVSPHVLDFPGYFPIALLHHRVDAPFQLLIDNMAELEHSASVHSVFGFDIDNLHQVKTEVAVSESELNIYYEGPQRRLPAYLGMSTGIKENDRFVQYAKIRFGPVYATYDLEWQDPHTGCRRPLQLKFVIFFNPVTDTRCEQFTFAFAQTSNPWLSCALKTFKGLLVKNIDKELSADIRLVESLRLTADQYDDYLLSRFDRPIREAAVMIDAQYFRNTQPDRQAVGIRTGTAP